MKRAAELDEIRAAAKKKQLEYLRAKYLSQSYGKSCQTQDTISTASSTQDPIETASQTQDPISKASQTQDPIETDSQTQDPSSQLHIPFYVAYTDRVEDVKARGRRGWMTRAQLEALLDA